MLLGQQIIVLLYMYGCLKIQQKNLDIISLRQNKEITNNVM